MLVIHDALRASDLPRGGIGTIGNYDGIHRGQQAVLDLVVARARDLRVPAVVVTFDPHPLAILHPDQAPVALATPTQKERLLDQSGVDSVVIVRFSREFAETPARNFVREFLAGTLELKEIYVGSGFVFGFRREGDLALLKQLGPSFGFAAFGVDEVAYHGQPISSTRIRQALSMGEVEPAAEMLGRPYSLTGFVVRGDRMGKRLGWPTINLEPDNELLLADGVYATRVYFPSFPASFDCVTNIGTRPTVYENYQRVIESHILDFSSDVYGERLELSFFKRLREERIFPTVMDLSVQIGRDVEATREYFLLRRRLEKETAAVERRSE